ncbi:universal stress protein [Phytohalomonas tamaricis]|uniref:universal stress protein n=1 Tax=Phytohalomonas tamaricis TaxID=2081032 RepID=UPI000D0B5C3B|nr:universal stress protein [Phytohalomonas tamaricis]
MTTRVMGCIDGSSFATAVCDYAAWASLKLGAPLTFLHALDEHVERPESDLSGNIGLGSREHLLEELAQLDEQHGKLARQHGQLMLEDVRQRAEEKGCNAPQVRQRHGGLVEALAELEDEIRLLVLGKRGEAAATASEHLGSNLERVIRAVHKPVLVAIDDYRDIKRVMIAFDNSATTRRGVEMLAAGGLLNGLACHVVTIGADSEAAQKGLPWAEGVLSTAGIDVTSVIRSGDVEETLASYARDNAIDLMVMGAYGHSRIRHLLVGSTTTAMIRNTQIPLLLLR